MVWKEMCFLWMTWISRQGGKRGTLPYPLQLSAGLPVSAGKAQAQCPGADTLGKAPSSSPWLNLSLAGGLEKSLPPSRPPAIKELLKESGR